MLSAIISRIFLKATIFVLFLFLSSCYYGPTEKIDSHIVENETKSVSSAYQAVFTNKDENLFIHRIGEPTLSVTTKDTFYYNIASGRILTFDGKECFIGDLPIRETSNSFDKKVIFKHIKLNYHPTDAFFKLYLNYVVNINELLSRIVGGDSYSLKMFILIGDKADEVNQEEFAHVFAETVSYLSDEQFLAVLDDLQTDDLLRIQGILLNEFPYSLEAYMNIHYPKSNARLTMQ